MNNRNVAIGTIFVAVVSAGLSLVQAQERKDVAPFQIIEATIDDIQAAFKSGRLTARQLVQGYLDRIAAYDKRGPNINSIITLNEHALEDAKRQGEGSGQTDPTGQAAAELIQVVGFAAHDARSELFLSNDPRCVRAEGSGERSSF